MCNNQYVLAMGFKPAMFNFTFDSFKSFHWCAIPSGHTNLRNSTKKTWNIERKSLKKPGKTYNSNMLSSKVSI